MMSSLHRRMLCLVLISITIGASLLAVPSTDELNKLKLSMESTLSQIDSRLNSLLHFDDKDSSMSTSMVEDRYYILFSEQILSSNPLLATFPLTFLGTQKELFRDLVGEPLLPILSFYEFVRQSLIDQFVLDQATYSGKKYYVKVSDKHIKGNQYTLLKNNKQVKEHLNARHRIYFMKDFAVKKFGTPKYFIGDGYFMDHYEQVVGDYRGKTSLDELANLYIEYGFNKVKFLRQNMAKMSEIWEEQKGLVKKFKRMKRSQSHRKIKKLNKKIIILDERSREMTQSAENLMSFQRRLSKRSTWVASDVNYHILFQKQRLAPSVTVQKALESISSFNINFVFR
jgi:hypothetical protein